MITAVEQLRVPTAAAQPPSAPSVRRGHLLLVAAVGVVIWLIPRPAAVDPRAWHLLARDLICRLSFAHLRYVCGYPRHNK